MKSGEYGIKIILTGYDQATTYLPTSMASSISSEVRTTKEFILNFSDMIGANLYNTQGYCNQEKVFDITNFVITGISVELYQDGNFIDINNNAVRDQRIYFTNFYLHLGYDISEFYNTDTRLFLYTTDGLLYNNSYRTKSLQVRYTQLNDSDHSILSDETNLLTNSIGMYNIIWESYDPNYAGSSPYSNQVAYKTVAAYEKGTQTVIPEEETYGFTTGTIILTTARNRLKCSYIYNLYNTETEQVYSSNTIDFANQAYIQGSELLDILTGFQVTTAEEDGDYNGKFFIYGQDSKSNDKIISSKLHYLILSYMPNGDDSSTQGFQEGDIIEWSYSTNNTMLKAISQGDLDGVNIETKLESNLYIFTKVLTNSDIDSSERKFRLPYRIEDYYSNAYTNNSINCTFTRGAESYKASIDILFGTSGSQGNEYNLDIKLYNYNSTTKESIQVNSINLDGSLQNNYYIEAKLYDYNNKEKELTNSNNTYQFKWEVIQSDPNIISYNIVNGRINITSVIGNDMSKVKPVLIKCTLTDNANQTEEILSGIYLLAFSNGNYSVNNNTLITYDITGKKPVYTKNQLKIEELDDNEDFKNNIVTWKIIPDDDEAWRPIISNNELIAPSIYHKESSTLKYSLICQIKNNGVEDTIWSQPIYMQQDKYPLGLQFKERNPLSFTDASEKVITIDNTLVGRLQQTSENKISGIVMGELSKDNTHNLLGLYAYHDNTNFLQIDENGYIYLNGGTDDGSENGGVNITDAYITNSTLEDISITNSTLENISITSIIPSTIKYKANDDEYKNLLTINSDGTITINQLITGTITTANYANSANTFSDHNSVIYRNFVAIQNALGSFLNPLHLDNNPYTIIEQ